MKYKINEDFPRKKQKFSCKDTDFKFDEKTKKLVNVGFIDLFAKVQANKDCALDVILDKFGYDEILYGLNNPDVINSDEIYEYVGKNNDYLENLTEFKDMTNNWRKTLNIDDSVSDSQLLSFMHSNSDFIKNRIKEVFDNAKKKKMTIRQNKRDFRYNAVKLHKKNLVTNYMRGGIML